MAKCATHHLPAAVAQYPEELTRERKQPRGVAEGFRRRRAQAYHRNKTLRQNKREISGLHCAPTHRVRSRLCFSMNEQKPTCRNVPCNQTLVHVPIVEGPVCLVENHCPAAAATSMRSTLWPASGIKSKERSRYNCKHGRTCRRAGALDAGDPADRRVPQAAWHGPWRSG